MLGTDVTTPSLAGCGWGGQVACLLRLSCQCPLAMPGDTVSATIASVASRFGGDAFGYWQWCAECEELVGRAWPHPRLVVHGRGWPDVTRCPGSGAPCGDDGRAGQLPVLPEMTNAEAERIWRSAVRPSAVATGAEMPRGGTRLWCGLLTAVLPN